MEMETISKKITLITIILALSFVGMPVATLLADREFGPLFAPTQVSTAEVPINQEATKPTPVETIESQPASTEPIAAGPLIEIDSSYSTKISRPEQEERVNPRLPNPQAGRGRRTRPPSSPPSFEEIWRSLESRVNINDPAVNDVLNNARRDNIPRTPDFYAGGLRNDLEELNKRWGGDGIRSFLNRDALRLAAQYIALYEKIQAGQINPRYILPLLMYLDWKLEDLLLNRRQGGFSGLINRPVRDFLIEVQGRVFEAIYPSPPGYVDPPLNA